MKEPTGSFWVREDPYEEEVMLQCYSKFHGQTQHLSPQDLSPSLNQKLLSIHFSHWFMLYEYILKTSLKKQLETCSQYGNKAHSPRLSTPQVSKRVMLACTMWWKNSKTAGLCAGTDLLLIVGRTFRVTFHGISQMCSFMIPVRFSQWLGWEREGIKKKKTEMA